MWLHDELIKVPSSELEFCHATLPYLANSLQLPCVCCAVLACCACMLCLHATRVLCACMPRLCVILHPASPDPRKDLQHSLSMRNSLPIGIKDDAGVSRSQSYAHSSSTGGEEKYEAFLVCACNTGSLMPQQSAIHVVVVVNRPSKL